MPMVGVGEKIRALNSDGTGLLEQRLPLKWQKGRLVWGAHSLGSGQQVTDILPGDLVAPTKVAFPLSPLSLKHQ